RKLLLTALESPCDIILTSRNYILPPPSFRYDRRLVNQGFNNKQIELYIQLYFSSLPKSDKKMTKNIHKLINQNIKLHDQAKNPLILMLICSFYYEAIENEKIDLQKLKLLDLYDHTFSIFIRRYLDAQSKYLKKPCTLAETKNSSLSDLLALCPV